MDKFVILRDSNAVSTAEPFEAGARRIRTLGAGVPPSPKIEFETLSASDVAEIARDPRVLGLARAMPTRLIEPFRESLAASSTWGIDAVGAGTSPWTGAGTIVAVLDTGIARDHSAFAGVNLVEKDFSGSGDGDRQGHGTHCAGTVFGRDVGGVRIGVARGVEKALIGKVLGDSGAGDTLMLLKGLEWAVGQGADVISMSLGFDFPGYIAELTSSGWPPALAASRGIETYRSNLRLFDAIMAMVSARGEFGSDPVVIAAAGNESERGIDPDYEIAASLPSCAEGVVSVAALGQSAGGGLEVAGFSNTFATVSAPGVRVQSADARNPNGLIGLSGTSMACPHAAGVAALWWQAERASGAPTRSRSILARLIARASRNGFVPGTDPVDRGEGIVQAP